MVIPYSSGCDTSSFVRETEECEFNEALCAPVEEPVAIILAPIPKGHVDSKAVVTEMDAVRQEAAKVAEVVKEAELIELIEEPRIVALLEEGYPQPEIIESSGGISCLVAIMNESTSKGAIWYPKHSAAVKAITDVLLVWPVISFSDGFPPGPPKKPPPWFIAIRIFIIYWLIMFFYIMWQSY